MPTEAGPRVGPFSARPARVRPLLEAFVPAAADLDAGELIDLLARADRTIAHRDPAIRRQLGAALLALDLLILLRFMRPPSRVAVTRRRRFLETLQDAPIRLIRLAVWGVRTLCFAGYYGDTSRHEELGYRPDPRGWDAISGADDHG